MELDLVSRMLFPRPPATYNVDSFAGELLWVPRSLNPQTARPEDCIPLCLLQCPLATCFVVYFHSNFEDIGRCYRFCENVRNEVKAHVLIVEYPGYGICPGLQCDAQAAADCSRVVLRFVREVLRVPRLSTILVGRSIGTGIATLLAAEHRYAGLVLICPFLSIKDLVSQYIGPAAGLVAERFANKENIRRVQAPCLFVHGQDDKMVPSDHSQQLYEACESRKYLCLSPEMGHNSDLVANRSFFMEPMIEFLKHLGTTAFSLQVPSWAFDRQMCPQFVEHRPSLVGQSQLACWNVPVSCSPCGGGNTGCNGCQGCIAHGQHVTIEPSSRNTV
ncbi:unnamed protein product, partial [Polarella glacialis]